MEGRIKFRLKNTECLQNIWFTLLSFRHYVYVQRCEHTIFF